MCIFKQCPIFDKCEKEAEQVVYCRHVEMIKKIALMREEVRKKKLAALPTFSEPKQTVSEPPATMAHVSTHSATVN